MKILWANDTFADALTLLRVTFEPPHHQSSRVNQMFCRCSVHFHFDNHPTNTRHLLPSLHTSKQECNLAHICAKLVSTCPAYFPPRFKGVVCNWKGTQHASSYSKPTAYWKRWKPYWEHAGHWW
uniref:Uncharacterized protein n=1 Tax=Trypanosoma vivax (strain Y486) TaxID=1055687 RepID=G0TWA5_TRYVY|nr:hypothetical protein TVY486_0600340 [Trypanosoma vivax Y486]